MVKPSLRILKVLINPKPSLGITIRECGWSRRNGSKSPIKIDNWLRTEYIMVCLLKGSGKLHTTSTGLKQIKPGDVFVIPPGRWHRYGPEPGEEWHEYFIIFEGSGAQALLRNTFKSLYRRNETMVAKIEIDKELRDFFKILYRHAAKNDHKGCAALFFMILQRIENSVNKTLSQKDPAFVYIIEEINANPLADIDFRKISETRGMSYSLFRKKFVMHMGVPPYKYLLQLRMQIACDLLKNGMSVKEACYEIGMNDPSHFSKLFKKIIGVSPNLYIEKSIK